MSLNAEERKAVVEFRLEKAQRAYDQACGVVLYHDLFTMRLTGDYDDTYGLTKNDVLPYLEPAKQMIQEVSALALKRIKEKQTFLT
ncbi:MAG: hypothetical protein IKQ37_11230 [Bacteroidaceae bacterium]|nr:hypothetical protein [Bacteroidaceae bacterium]